MESNGQTSWQIAGDEVTSCNCVWACPCQFNALPNEGDCHAVVAFSIDEGRFGETDMAGVRFAEAVSWPGAIHEGDGTAQLFLDESSSAEQQEAVKQIASGENGGAYFEIFSSVLPHVREPIVTSIAIECDRETRHASVQVGDYARSTIEPIKNPVDGEEHRVRIDLPDGFEYTLAEIANTAELQLNGDAPLGFELSGTYAQLNAFDFSNT